MLRPAAGSKPYINKWVTFSASAFIQACAGLSYSFSIYAPTLKDKLGLSQTEIASVGSAVNLGGYFAVVAGSIYDNMEQHHKFGPRLVIWLGSLCCFCGYAGLYLLASGKAPGEFIHLVLFATCAGNAGVWFDTSALVTNVRNFPNDKGFVVGILKSFLGLSASIFTSIYMAFYEPDVIGYLLLLALLPTVLTALLAGFVNHVPYVEQSETVQRSSWLSTEGRFLLSYFLVALIALYQMTSAVLIGHEHLGHTARLGIAAALLALLLLMLFLPLRSGGFWSAYAHGNLVALDAESGESSGEEQSRPGHAAARRHVISSRRGRQASAKLPLLPALQPPPSYSGQQHSKQQQQQQQLQQQELPRTSSRASSASEGAEEPLLEALDSSGGSSARHGSSHVLHGSSNMPHGSSEPKDRGGIVAVSLPRVHGPSPEGPGACDAEHAASQPKQHSTAAMLASIDFWLFFFQFMVGTGLALAFLNNLGQLVAALGGGHDGHVVFVSLFSVANAGGRLLLGYIPEHYLHTKGTPRTLFLFLVATLMAAIALATAYASLQHLYIISVLLGLAFGAHWTLLPTIISDLFGPSASNYATLQFAPAAGSYLLATCLTGWLYDAAAKAHGDPHFCKGADCFHSTFLLLAGLAVLSAFSSLLGLLRSRRAYRAIHRHMHQVEVAEETLISS